MVAVNRMWISPEVRCVIIVVIVVDSRRHITNRGRTFQIITLLLLGSSSSRLVTVASVCGCPVGVPIVGRHTAIRPRDDWGRDRLGTWTAATIGCLPTGG